MNSHTQAPAPVDMKHSTHQLALRLSLSALLGLCLLLSLPLEGYCQPFAAAKWLDAYSFQPLQAHRGMVAEFVSDEIPKLLVTPAALGRQIVRASLPLPAGALAEGIQMKAFAGGGAAAAKSDVAIECGTRVLSYHPGQPRWARRVLITFVYDFANEQPVEFSFARELVSSPIHPVQHSGG